VTKVTAAKIIVEAVQGGKVRGIEAARATCRAYEMGADIAANPHYPTLSHILRLTSSRSASLAISSPQNDALRRTPEQSGDGLVGPLSGAGRTWKALHHLFLRLPKQSLSKRWTAFPVPDLVRINSWESLRSVIRLPVDFLVNPSVLFRLVLQLPLMSRWFVVSVVR
jgi:hypothetical protein